MRDGEFLTLLGPSGSGKTTMLSLVSGLTEPTAGDIWIDGRRVTHERSSKRDIGMVFQNYALFPHLSVYENIAFPLRMRKLSRADIDRAVRRVLDIVHLPQVAERLPRELSGGQQQRIALARCIVYEPSIILMDEPLGALDKNLREHMQAEIKRLHVELGITILYVTHDQDEALSMSDRICLMNQARIEQIGTPSDLYFRPASEFVARFLGESNIAHGSVAEVGTEVAIGIAGGSRVRVQHYDGLRSGQNVRWMVRPECLRIADGSTPYTNLLRGELVKAIFVGGVTKLHVRIADGSIFVAKELTSGRPLPECGQTVVLGWSPSDTTLLPVNV